MLLGYVNPIDWLLALLGSLGGGQNSGDEGTK